MNNNNINAINLLRSRLLLTNSTINILSTNSHALSLSTISTSNLVSEISNLTIIYSSNTTTHGVSVNGNSKVIIDSVTCNGSLFGISSTAMSCSHSTFFNISQTGSSITNALLLNGVLILNNFTYNSDANNISVSNTTIQGTCTKQGTATLYLYNCKTSNLLILGGVVDQNMTSINNNLTLTNACSLNARNSLIRSNVILGTDQIINAFSCEIIGSLIATSNSIFNCEKSSLGELKFQNNSVISIDHCNSDNCSFENNSNSHIKNSNLKILTFLNSSISRIEHSTCGDCIFNNSSNLVMKHTTVQEFIMNGSSNYCTFNHCIINEGFANNSINSQLFIFNSFIEVYMDINGSNLGLVIDNTSILVDDFILNCASCSANFNLVKFSGNFTNTSTSSDVIMNQCNIGDRFEFNADSAAEMKINNTNLLSSANFISGQVEFTGGFITEFVDFGTQNDTSRSNPQGKFTNMSMNSFLRLRSGRFEMYHCNVYNETTYFIIATSANKTIFRNCNLRSLNCSDAVVAVGTIELTKTAIWDDSGASAGDGLTVHGVIPNTPEITLKDTFISYLNKPVGEGNIDVYLATIQGSGFAITVDASWNGRKVQNSAGDTAMVYARS